jgi:hypothetical protein
MQWQDVAITAGTIVLLIALLPSVLSKNKPAVSTSLMTGTVLVVFTVVYISLGLWFSAITTGITSILWYVLAMQMLLRKK